MNWMGALSGVAILATLSCGGASGPVAEERGVGPSANGSGGQGGTTNGSGGGPSIGSASGTGATGGGTASCTPGEERPCYTGPEIAAGVGACALGTQACEIAGELATWGACEGSILPSDELCGSGLDDDCDGQVDEDCPEECLKTVQLDISGDCVTVQCPPDAPYPYSCDVQFIGDTPHGCVASTPSSPEVFFKEGVVCDAGYLKGTLICSCKQGTGLDATNCSINKTYKHYETAASACP